MVAFIDILGFDSRVRSIKSQEEFFEVGKLLFALKETEKSFNKDKQFFSSLTMTAISDSVIVTIPYHDPVCAMAIITVIQKIQYDLIATSFETLLRGYLTSVLYRKFCIRYWQYKISLLHYDIIRK